MQLATCFYHSNGRDATFQKQRSFEIDIILIVIFIYVAYFQMTMTSKSIFNAQSSAIQITE